jgi:hypothetical protein
VPPLQRRAWDACKFSSSPTAGGGLVADARLRLLREGGGTTAEMAWTLKVLLPALRLASRIGRPLLRWGHDCVVEIAVAGFRRRMESF